jgi:tetratricopeptide (TPR) repeat protein
VPGNIQRPNIPSTRPSQPGGSDRPGIGNLPSLPGRPGGGDRPGIGNLPSLPGRPGGGDRPGSGGDRPGSGGTWPSRPNLPNISNRPNLPNISNRPSTRPDWNNPYRPGNRPNNNNNNNNNNNSNNINNINNINNNWTNINVNNNYNRWGGGYGGWNRPWYPNYYAYHYNWHHGNWSGWNRYPSFWFWGTAAALTTGWALGATTNFVYSNPYYVAPATPIVIESGQPSTTVVYAPDYSQQLIAPPPPPTPVDTPPATAEEDAPPPPPPTPEPPEPDADETAALEQFAKAREEFKAGKYAEATRSVDLAIAKSPKDAVLHEFRALTLFAQGKYQEAAATLYAVLAAGPGWTWETQKSLYPDTATFTKQLRALESFCKQNPKDGAAPFVLAYQYLVLGHPEDAAVQFEKVAQIVPENKLAAELAKVLSTPADAPAPAPRPEGATQ